MRVRIRMSQIQSESLGESQSENLGESRIQSE